MSSSARRCGVCARARGRRRSMSSPRWVGGASSATPRRASWSAPASSATAHTISRRARTGRSGTCAGCWRSSAPWTRTRRGSVRPSAWPCCSARWCRACCWGEACSWYGPAAGAPRSGREREDGGARRCADRVQEAPTLSGYSGGCGCITRYAPASGNRRSWAGSWDLWASMISRSDNSSRLRCTRFTLQGEPNEVLPRVLSPLALSRPTALQPHDSGPTIAGVGPKRNHA